MSPTPPPSSPEAANFDEPAIELGSPGAVRAATRERSTLGWLAFASVCLFWGTSSPLLRFTVRYVPPLWLVTSRFLVAGLLLWLGLWCLGRRPPWRGVWKILPSSVGLGATNLLVTFGFQRVEASTGTLLLATTAVAFAVVDLTWPGGTSKPTPKVWFGLLLGMLGVAVLVISPTGVGRSAWQGSLLLELSAWTWAVSGVAQARHPSGMGPLQSSAWQMLFAGVLTWPFAWLTGSPQLASMALEGWLGMAALIVTASLIAFVSFVYVLHSLPAYVVGAYTYVNAIVAAAVAVLWLGERISTRFWAAGVLVMAGVAIIQHRPRESSRG